MNSIQFSVLESLIRREQVPAKLFNIDNGIFGYPLKIHVFIVFANMAILAIYCLYINIRIYH